MTQRKFNDIDYVNDIELASFTKETYEADAVRRERFGQFTRRFTDISDGATVSYYIENISDANPITVVSPQIQSTQGARLQVIRNVNSYGTSNSQQNDVYNLQTDSDIQFDETIHARTGTNVAIDGGTIIDESIIPGTTGGGTGAQRVGGTSRNGLVSRIAAGDDIVLRVTNTSGNSTKIAGTVPFVQENDDDLPEQNRKNYNLFK